VEFVTEQSLVRELYELIQRKIKPGGHHVIPEVLVTSHTLTEPMKIMDNYETFWKCKTCGPYILYGKVRQFDRCPKCGSSEVNQRCITHSTYHEKGKVCFDKL
jgi:hypothetical protein